MHFKVAAEDKTNHRYSGVLVHPTSFPSPYGIGDMGRGAHEFIDFLAMAGQHLWQGFRLDRLATAILPTRAILSLQDRHF